MTTLNVEVDATIPADDASEDSGTVSISAGGFSWSPADTADWMGFRWRNVALPKDCSISAALMSVALGKAIGQINKADFKFWGEASDNAAVFAASSNNISTRTPTTAFFAWFDSTGYTQVASPEYYQIGDAATILQEVVTRSGWSSGNAIVIIGRAQGTALTDARVQMSDTRLTGWPWGARLAITYTENDSIHIKRRRSINRWKSEAPSEVLAW